MSKNSVLITFTSVLAVLLGSIPIAGADPVHFKIDDPIGRMLKTKLSSQELSFGYFCLNRKADDAGNVSCTHSQFAKSAVGTISRDLLGNIVAEEGAWTPVGPVFTKESMTGFVARLKSTENGTLFDRIWAAIWDRGVENWQFIPREVDSKDLSKFVEVLFAESGPVSIEKSATQIQADARIAARMKFAGTWISDTICKGGGFSCLILVTKIRVEGESLVMRLYSLETGYDTKSKATFMFEVSESSRTLSFTDGTIEFVNKSKTESLDLFESGSISKLVYKDDDEFGKKFRTALFEHLSDAESKRRIKFPKKDN